MQWSAIAAELGYGMRWREPDLAGDSSLAVPPWSARVYSGRLVLLIERLFANRTACVEYFWKYPWMAGPPRKESF